MLSKFRTTFATAAAAAMVLGTAGLAVADDVEVTSTYFQTETRTIVMEVGDTASVTLGYVATGDGQNPEDGKSGCNLGGPGAHFTMGVTETADPAGGAGIDGLPASVVFTACEVTVDGVKGPASQDLTFEATSPGTTTVSFPAQSFTTNHEKVTLSSFDTSGASFVVTVTAPEEDEGRDAPAIANEYLKGLDSDKLEACKLANGTNKNKANWHGQLISKVAQHFEGQTFGPSKEHVVTDYVDSQC
jgi:hypothetical protein